MRLVSQRTVDVSVSMHSVTAVVEEIPKVVIIERIEQLPLMIATSPGPRISLEEAFLTTKCD